MEYNPMVIDAKDELNERVTLYKMYLDSALGYIAVNKSKREDAHQCTIERIADYLCEISAFIECRLFLEFDTKRCRIWNYCRAWMMELADKYEQLVREYKELYYYWSGGYEPGAQDKFDWIVEGLHKRLNRFN